MSKRSIVLLSVGMALMLLLTVFIVKVADGTFHGIQHGPEITASPEATLKYPEPTISADSGAKVPDQPKPTVQSQAAPSSPANIPAAPQQSSPVYPFVPVQQAPIPPALVPLPAPQQPPVASVPTAPDPLLPPVVSKPVEGLVGPLKPIVKPLVPPLLTPITDPLLDTVGKILK